MFSSSEKFWKGPTFKATEQYPFSFFKTHCSHNQLQCYKTQPAERLYAWQTTEVNDRFSRKGSQEPSTNCTFTTTVWHSHSQQNAFFSGRITNLVTLTRCKNRKINWFCPASPNNCKWKLKETLRKFHQNSNDLHL